MDKDYYKIMGVSQTASEQEIKTAYRKLARKYHPDVSKEPNAEERFKEMGEAYEVLGNAQKRAEYDSLRQQEALFQQQRNRQSTKRPQGDYHFGGEQMDTDLFESLFGHTRYQQQPMAGQNYEGKISISLEEAFQGAVKNVSIPINQGAEVQTLKVKIPAGVKSGQQIRLAGQGGPGIHNGPRGSVYLTIEILKHTLFDVLDNDIYITLPITPWEAALGTTLVVPTLGGKIDLKIPPNSQGGQKLRLKNRGLPGSPPGNQYVLLKIITPPATTDEAKELYQKMAQTLPFNPRESMGV